MATGPSEESTQGSDNVCLFPDRHGAAAESHHRIANSLALLASSVSLVAGHELRRQRELDSDEVSRLLQEISARIATIGQLHRTLSRAPEERQIDLNAHLFDLCETLLDTLAPEAPLELIRSAPRDCPIDSDQVLPVCLIVTEVIINSLKYAHPAGAPGKLWVGCHRDGDHVLSVEVSDDGVGLPEGFDLASDGGLGSRTIRRLAAQLGAETCFSSEPLGLRFTLRVPLRGGRDAALRHEG